MFDNFDLGVTCEEYYDEDNWIDADVENVMVNGIPLDGHYLDHMIEQLED